MGTRVAGVFLRCVVISVVLGLFAPLVFMSPFIPEEGERVIDWSSAQDIPKAPDTIQHISTREVHGFERIRFWFSGPYVWQLYFAATATCFAMLLLATLAVSYWNSHAARKAASAD